ncbi:MULTISPECIES: FecR domain-containing protein [Nitrosomonas]|uniref:FecR domain-containing protein n=1 Tax=Nitrosomonas TaxID=914 RepID=UPI002B387BD4|nr:MULTISPECIES: FecR domain-containing protein [Nitrosomonas]MEB2331483.1 general secretion pathway protein GspD [Nitrosomonas sp.]HRN80925.1 general secretion pathway protein GspD [Nitrosomonas europaea]HRQ08740.1 general secretion pathway protein GspD [Nitrosomonas europaea]
MNTTKRILILLLLALITGCAMHTTRNPSFLEGKRLIAEGRLEEGLGKLEQAAREEPDDREVGATLARERDTIIGQILFEADNARLAGNLDQAEQNYQRVLNIRASSERAREGLDAVDLERRHIVLVNQAKEALAHGDVDGAEKIVRGVLADNPMQSEARQLIKALSEQIARAEMSELSLITEFSKPITMEFRDTSLKTMFELISRTAGINFVFDRNVQQEATASIFVRDNSIEDVLKLMLLTNQLAYKVLNSNTLLIYPDTPAKQKDYQELVVRSFHVANTDVKQMVAMIRGLVKARDIYVNEKLNLFVIRDTLEMIRLVERLVAINDFPDPEVMLDVVVLEVKRDSTLDLGPNMPTSVTFSAVPGIGTPAQAAADSVVKMSMIKNTGFEGLRSFTISNQAKIDFGRTLTNADVLANPRIRVKSREKAKIHIGNKEPVFTVTNTANVGSAASATYIDVGLKFEVEPVVRTNNEVTLKALLEVSSNLGEKRSGSGENAATAIVIGTRTAETVLELRDGETQVLAGLIQDDLSRVRSGIAGLTDIPVLGDIFSKQVRKHNKTEIILLITPHIVRNVIQPNHFESEFYSGTASAAGKLPVTIRKTAPRSLAMESSNSASDGGYMSLGRARSAGLFGAAPDLFEEAVTQAREASPSLTLRVPESVAGGREFTATVRLVTQDPMLSGELNLTYDPDTLELVDGGEKSGMRSLKLGRDQSTGMTAVLRFKVISTNATSTEIALQNLQVRDETGQPVEVNLPSAASIRIQ